MRKKSEKAFHDLRRRLSRNLARLRAEQGCTLTALGERAGMHWRHLQKIEAGEANVTLSTLARLALGLEVDALELLAKLH